MSTYQKKEILIVDDCEPFLSQLVDGIEKFDWNSYSCKVDAVSNVDSALEMSQNHDYNLIITDMQMPDKSGSCFIKNLRKINKYCKTPVIVMSGFFRMPPSSEYGIYAENLIFIDKPFTLSNLRKVVNSALSTLPNQTKGKSS